MLAFEMDGKARAVWLLRIRARLNKLRGRRERAELEKVGSRK